MPATRSTTKPQRKTQSFRQASAHQDRDDYHQCSLCGDLFSHYHNAYKRHFRLCEARSQRLRDEEAQTLIERYTPTPEPYTPAPSEDTQFELGAGFGSVGIAPEDGAPMV